MTSKRYKEQEKRLREAERRKKNGIRKWRSEVNRFGPEEARIPKGLEEEVLGPAELRVPTADDVDLGHRIRSAHNLADQQLDPFVELRKRLRGN